MPWSGPLPVYVAKGARVYVSGLLSVMLPYYLVVLGNSPFFVGVVLAMILAGNAMSNVLITYSNPARRKLLLEAFSMLMVVSGLALATSESQGWILLAALVGNVSTTGTEAGPFQSIEAGILPDLVPERKVVRAFGEYNLVGYAASSLGAFTLYLPGSLGNDLHVFRALFLVFAGVGALLFVIYGSLAGIIGRGGHSHGGEALGAAARREVGKLSALYSVDAFGGSFVSQYLLSYWFHLTYSTSDTTLAVMFLVANILSAGSTYAAAFIAERIGNLRTMVSTHLLSNAFLLLVAFAGSFVGSVAFLFLRQGFSQMDVPTRQALMAEMFGRDERVPAYAITNTVRTGGAFLGGPVSAALLAAGTATGILVLGGTSKIIYDGLVYREYRKRFR